MDELKGTNAKLNQRINNLEGKKNIQAVKTKLPEQAFGRTQKEQRIGQLF